MHSTYKLSLYHYHYLILHVLDVGMNHQFQKIFQNNKKKKTQTYCFTHVTLSKIKARKITGIEKKY